MTLCAPLNPTIISGPHPSYRYVLDIPAEIPNMVCQEVKGAEADYREWLDNNRLYTRRLMRQRKRELYRANHPEPETEEPIETRIQTLTFTGLAKLEGIEWMIGKFSNLEIQDVILSDWLEVTLVFEREKITSRSFKWGKN